MNGGADQFSQENSLLFPPELQFEPIDDGEPGTALLSNSNNLNLNLGTSAVFTFTPAQRRFQRDHIGRRRRIDPRPPRLAHREPQSRRRPRNRRAPEPNMRVLEQRQRVEDFGLFAQEEFLTLSERLLLRPESAPTAAAPTATPRSTSTTRSSPAPSDSRSRSGGSTS